jgi:hypothetical protein
MTAKITRENTDNPPKLIHRIRIRFFLFEGRFSEGAGANQNL